MADTGDDYEEFEEEEEEEFVEQVSEFLISWLVFSSFYCHQTGENLQD